MGKLFVKAGGLHKLAVDVLYTDGASIAGVVFENWDDETTLLTLKCSMINIAEYEPGSFYKRELPCLLKILTEKSLSNYEIGTIIVDGYVFLDDSGRKGLGAHLYNELNCEINVVGVAKNYFPDANCIKKVLEGTVKTLFMPHPQELTLIPPQNTYKRCMAHTVCPLCSSLWIHLLEFRTNKATNHLSP